MSDPTPQKNQAPGTTSDGQVGRLDELSRKAQEAQRTVAASVAEDRQKLSAAVASAEDKADQGAQRLQAHGQRAKVNVAGTWNLEPGADFLAGACGLGPREAGGA
ncbi:hypothetical protein [Streptomyces mirabilis]|uniref:hypothetical protein n=1 Tax=Streptomyces mirabilis TaxID=68239 RepID=UPI0036A0F833